MWNSEAPLKLLQSMPAQLTIENLKAIQKIIDVDKYLNSEQRKSDLCGLYAPFCKNCDKGVMKYPCAVAYVLMKQAEGHEVEIAATEEELAVGAPDEEESVVEEVQEETSVQLVEEPSEQPEPKKFIRIAIARRKH